MPSITHIARLGLAVLLLTFTLGGCFDNLSNESAEKDQDPNSGEPPNDDQAPQCTTTSDCVLAASTCCECPSFSAPSTEGYDDADCEAVECGPQGVCPAVEPQCDTGVCVMICSPLIADRTCAVGFVRDEAGCLRNACVVVSDELAICEFDEDCTQIPADCCGCALGGVDQSVPVSEADSFLGGLDCPPNPSCPEVNVCDPEQVPRCIAGACTLGIAPTDIQPDPSTLQLCGTPQLSMCPVGSLCILNAEAGEMAATLGVGSCVPE